MKRDQLLKKLTTIVDDAASQCLYGNIEIEFRAGEAVFIRKTQQEKLDDRENPHGTTYRR
jgi:hypothetical protein